MGQISVEKSDPNGSLLGENQQEEDQPAGIPLRPNQPSFRLE
jgi:hypothetical protein